MGKVKQLVIVITLLIIVGFLGIRFLIFPHMNDLKGVHQTCRDQKLGVTVAELTKLFGEPKFEFGEYRFGSKEYAQLYSSYIVATVDKQGNVTRLLCGEGIPAWPSAITMRVRPTFFR